MGSGYTSYHGKVFLRIPHCTRREWTTVQKIKRSKWSYIFLMALKSELFTPQIVVPKNLDGASGFALNKVSVVFMGIMVWSS